MNGPALTGGAGGEITGTDAATNYAGGSGGAGLNLNGGTSYVNSGTFTGGAGGAADGIGKNLFGGAGGDGLYTNSSTANVYGGTFQGGDSGLPIGTGVLGNYSAGNGLNANDNSTVNIYGGNFTGGDQARFPGSVGFGGDGLSDEGGTVNVYGGNFTGGTGSDFGDLAILSGTTTLYGSDFFVNGVAFSGGSVTGSGTITGILQDNGFTSTFTYEAGGFGGTLNIISAPAVPEASTTVSFGLLLALGLGGLVVAARRKKIAP